MSNIFGAPRAGAPNGSDESRTVPTGDTVGSYTSYLDAQKAVDYLADQQFPVQMVSIVGNDLKMVERVTGRLSYPRVALSGALSGMWFGLFVGVMLSFFSTTRRLLLHHDVSADGCSVLHAVWHRHLRHAARQA